MSHSQSRLKELEQEAHFVAGEQFLITSNNQLREVKLNFVFFFKDKICLRSRGWRVIYFEFISIILCWSSGKYISSPCFLTSRFIPSKPVNPRKVWSQNLGVCSIYLGGPSVAVAVAVTFRFSQIWDPLITCHCFVEGPLRQAKAAPAESQGDSSQNGAAETPVHIRSRGKFKNFPLSFWDSSTPAPRASHPQTRPCPLQWAVRQVLPRGAPHKAALLVWTVRKRKTVQFSRSNPLTSLTAKDN